MAIPTEPRRLTASEAESLWRAWKTRRDGQARDRLVLSYAPMVRYIASKKARELPTHCELDDLVSCGLVAIVEAVDRFDPAKGATFEQYAWTRVSGSITDELRRLDRVPRSSRALIRSYEKAQDSWFARSGRRGSEEEIAAQLGVDPEELHESIGEVDRAQTVSLNAPAARDSEARVEIGETIEAQPGVHEPERALLLSERSATFRAAMATLSQQERTVVALVHLHNRSGADVGRVLGVTESRVSQILAAARKKLRAELERYERTGERIAV
jgi:RNA polymerase sigma factor FliA